jgi:ParB family chromosome partitioning protein
MKSKGLGRGLSALMGENLIAESANDDGLNQLALDNIFPNPDQPRTIFNSVELDELASSIKQNGILQPILVKPMGGDKYQIIAGERRWRAAKMVGLINMPAIIKDMPEKEILEIALIENIQRENLSPLEEAESYKKLIDEYNYTQEKMAERVSKSRSHIANLLRLINLPEKVKHYLNQGLISLGHAKLLINQEEADHFVDLIVNNSLNVRETEDMIRQKSGLTKSPRPGNNSIRQEYLVPKDEDVIALENYLSESLGTLVKIDRYADGGSKIQIHCETLEQLDNVAQKLSSSIA